MFFKVEYSDKLYLCMYVKIEAISFKKLIMTTAEADSFVLEAEQTSAKVTPKQYSWPWR
jgi:hypothetical protein